jgi:hypothetical protein
MRAMKFALAIMVMGVVACAANVGTSGAIYVPKDSAATCSGYCNEIGLQMSSVVIMANNVGCVCSPALPPPGTAPGAETTPAAQTPATAASTAAAAGMAALVVAEEQREAQQRRQQR